MNESEQEARARELFKSFHKREPIGPREIIRVGGLDAPTVGLEVGRFVKIAYRAVGNGVFYEHEFESPLAGIYVRYDGRQIYVLGGGYRFTDRGFIG